MSEQKIEQFWRDATADDVAEIARNGVSKVARVRDLDFQEWLEVELRGWMWRVTHNWITLSGSYRFCQVYDPPQWYLDKPDPGEGWRLLEKFPAEDLESEDEYFISGKNIWSHSVVAEYEKQQQAFTWYRRRIEPVPQKGGWRSKDNIPSGWQKIPDDEPRLACDAYWSLGVADWVIIGDERVAYANSEKWPAIRQRDDLLIQGKAYALPKGLTLQVYKQGFEVF
jgi:hypothetical protein